MVRGQGWGGGRRRRRYKREEEEEEEEEKEEEMGRNAIKLPAQLGETSRHAQWEEEEEEKASSIHPQTRLV